MRQSKSEQLEIVLFFFFLSSVTVRVDFYAFVIEYDDSFFCFFAFMRYSIGIPISAFVANTLWKSSNILYVSQGHVKDVGFY